MAAGADLSRRVLMISGAIDVNSHDISVTFELPAPGRWEIVKSESNLTDEPWLAWQMVAGDDTSFIDDSDAMVVSRQYANTFMTPDRKRLTFYDGEVRPGEAVLKWFTIECRRRRAIISHARFAPRPQSSPEETKGQIEQAAVAGMPPKPVIETIIPVTVVG
ncbi:hypothetical protein HKK74_17450 [Actinomadura alba]|uniref:Uncharacterized protein n=2 Tax=Actinomadura alba TaxID=406431 RepID=A0ABR7LR34_9ACTN|nr:hypothetical protein [Actinomadura alba]